MVGKPLSSMFRVYRNANQNIPAGVDTVIEWDTENFDELDEMLIVNPWTFTPKHAGYYFVYVQSRIDNLLAGEDVILRLGVNGAIVADDYGIAAAITDDVVSRISALLYLIPTDLVNVYQNHSLGGVKQLAGGSNITYFFGYRVR